MRKSGVVFGLGAYNPVVSTTGGCPVSKNITSRNLADMFIRHIKKYVTRLLVVTLAVIILPVLFYASNSKASTCDDLRGLVGRNRLTSSSYRKQLLNMYSLYRAIEKGSLTVELIENAQKSIVETQSKYDKQYIEYVDKYENDFKQCASLDTINDDISNINSVKGKTTSSDTIKSVSSITKENSSKILRENSKEFQKMLSIVNSIGDNYDIGSIGSSGVFFIKAPFKLVYPFGKIFISSRGKKYIDCKSIVVAGQHQASEIGSAFNGEVIDSKKGKDGLYSVSIKSGQSLVVNYKGVSDCKVKKGDKVVQNEAIGSLSANMTYIEFLLDTEPVNPLVCFGSYGKQLYDKWLDENENVHADSPGIDNIINEVDESEQFTGINSNTGFKVDENYVSPSTGIVKRSNEE